MFEDTIGVIRICISKSIWTTEKGEKDKQRSTKHTHKTQDRVTRTPLIIGGEPAASGTRRVYLVTTPVISLVRRTMMKNI